MRRKHIFVILSLLVSLFIYLFYRTEKTVVNEIVISIISVESYSNIKASISRSFPLNKTLIYSLPEGLWVFCITLTSKSFYLQIYRWRIYGRYIPMIFCVGLEILQLLHITPGQFDLLDVGISVLFWLAGNCLFNDAIAKQNILHSFNREKLACIASYCTVYLSHVVK